MTPVFHRSVDLRGPAGRLEALLWTQSAKAPPAPLAALICHPHPLFGGTMHNKIVYQVAKTLHRLGLPVLRFNFRGAGLSEGTHDQGRGEMQDVAAALDFLAAEFPKRALLLAGYSFGAWVGLRVGCADPRVTHLVGVGIPVNDSDFSFLHGCAKPKLFVVGELDQFAARERVEALVASLSEPQRAATQLVFVPGADHFFPGKLSHVDAALRSWFAACFPHLRKS